MLTLFACSITFTHNSFLTYYFNYSCILICVVASLVSWTQAVACRDTGRQTIIAKFPEKNYVNGNVTFFCSSVSTTDILWHAKKSTENFFSQIYIAYAQDQENSKPIDSVVDVLLAGAFVEPYMYNHSLTIVGIPKEYHNSTWKCLSKMDDCSGLLQSERRTLLLSGKYNCNVIVIIIRQDEFSRTVCAFITMEATMWCSYGCGCHSLLNHYHFQVSAIAITSKNTVNQQILAAIKFGVSQNKVIWRLLNLASPRLCSVRSTYDHIFWRDKY